jgi:hypothetical protein
VKALLYVVGALILCVGAVALGHSTPRLGTVAVAFPLGSLAILLGARHGGRRCRGAVVLLREVLHYLGGVVLLSAGITLAVSGACGLAFALAWPYGFFPMEFVFLVTMLPSGALLTYAGVVVLVAAGRTGVRPGDHVSA